MLRGPVTSFLQNEPHMFRSVLLSNFHTARILDTKCKAQRKCDAPAVAIILSGCGALDGTEIAEAISSVIHICQKGMVPRFYAPDVDICDTVNHLTKESDPSCTLRNALVEAARLARSRIKPLCQCEVCRHQALVIPGGIGVTKTLSNFATKGCNCTVLPDVERIIEEFYCDKKPIASMCLGSILLPRVLKGCKITLGREKPCTEWPYAEAIQKVREMGGKVEIKGPKGITRCRTYNVLSTPAFMYAHATYGDVHSTIGKLITMLKKCISR